MSRQNKKDHNYRSGYSKTIWIDIENTPHVLFFRPIIEILNAKGCNVYVTARRCTQTVELLRALNIPFREIGCHFEGGNIFFKIMFVLFRVICLFIYIFPKNIAKAVCHCSRSMLITSKILRIKNICFLDYEHVAMGIFRHFADILIVPKHISKQSLVRKGFHKTKIIHLPGFKEEFYMVPSPTGDLIQKYMIKSDDVVVTLRPPAEKAHYHHSDAEALWINLIKYLDHAEGSLRVFVLHRYAFQEQTTKKLIHHNRDGRFIFLDVPEDGLNLLTLSDIVITGGGTMLREAAALGIPCYSLFTGIMGELDKSLIEEGRLNRLLSKKDVENIKLEKKSGIKVSPQANELKEFIIKLLLD